MDLKQRLPSREQLREIKSLRFLGDLIFETNLWAFNRHSVSFAILAGGFCCFMPMPFQMIPCLFLCIWWRCNVPLAVAIVWLSNPITMGPMMYFCYRLGLLLLGQATGEFPSNLDAIVRQLPMVWQPLLLGCVLCGSAVGGTGFVLVRLYWRIRIHRQVARRRAGRADA